VSEAASFVDTVDVFISISDNGMRAITAAPGRGFDCYGGASAEGFFYGLHLGRHSDREDALHWLEHGYPLPRPILRRWWSPIRGMLSSEAPGSVPTW
jgi:hypothetical protein